MDEIWLYVMERAAELEAERAEVLDALAMMTAQAESLGLYGEGVDDEIEAG